MNQSLALKRETLAWDAGIFDLRYLRRIDWMLLVLVVALAGVGVLTLFSANRSVSLTIPYYLLQLMIIVPGLALALAVACMDHRVLVALGPLFYTLLIMMLVAVLLFGVEAKGAQRWLELGPIRVQPSEWSKLSLILMLAWYFQTIGERVRKIFWFLLTFLIAVVPAALILKQPNLGTAAALGPITVAMLFMAGCKRWHLAATIGLGLAALPVGWSQLHDYQKSRVMTFLDPAADPQGSGYHTIQSMITVGSGGLTGKGYMAGTQTYLSYLPEHHTDFIFSVLAEEWGFLGASVVIALFGLLLLRGLSFAQSSRDLAGALLVVGIVALLAFHIVVNIAITIGLMPVTGIPLPFLSYGRSFYLTTMLCIGVLLSVYTRRET